MYTATTSYEYNTSITAVNGVMAIRVGLYHEYEYTCAHRRGNRGSCSPNKIIGGGQVVQGAPKKVIPWEKFDISGIVADFFRQIYSIYRGGFKPHMLRISLQKLM